MHLKTLVNRRRLAQIGVVATIAAGTLVATASPSWAAAAVLTLNQTAGPNSGGNTLIATTPAGTIAAPTPTFVTGQVVVQVQWATATTTACNAKYTAQTAMTPPSTPGPATAGIQNIPSANVLVMTANKISISIPTAFFGASTTGRYNVCVYPDTVITSDLLAGVAGAGQYSIAAKASITSVSPPAGPATGGTTVTVVGTNFPLLAASMSLTIGGVPATNIVPINATSFTAVTGAHGAGLSPVTVSLTTAGGTVIKSGAFTYANGIVVTPSTSPTNKPLVPIDVQGAGFFNLTFSGTGGGTPFDSGAHVYLVQNAYNPTGTTTKQSGPVAECNNVRVVTDAELVCSLNLAMRYMKAGTPFGAPRTITTTSTGVGTTIVTAAPAFTQDDLGSSFSGTGIASDTTITAVSADGQTATVSPATTAALVAGALTLWVGAPDTGPRSITTTSSGATTSIAAAAGTFNTDDVGHRISGTGIANDTTITAVSTDGSTATISPTSTGSLVAGALMVGAGTSAATGTNASTALTGATGLTQADVGKAVTGTNVAAGSILTAVGTAGAATLSIAATGAVTAVTVTDGSPVPKGTYTVTVVSNGLPGTQIGGANYAADFLQTVVSSGGTFTVADFN